MTTEMQQTEQTSQPNHGQTTKMIGHVLASISLLPSVIFWTDYLYVNASEEPGLKLNGFQWFKIMGVAVVLAAIATVLRSKLWLVALPVSLLMFFFTMYVMGS